MKQLSITRKAITRIGILTMCIALLISTITINTSAATAEKVVANLSPQTNIVVDGVSRTFYNVSGEEVHPIFYNNSIYLPVRSICELIDKNINWNQATLTATISGKRTTANVVGTPDASATSKQITVEIRPDFTIIMDGKVQNFKDANGAKVYPMLYKGTIYLPIRAMGELTGKTVTWDSKTSTATLTSGTNNGSLVTDVDGFDNSTTSTPPNNNQAYIGEAKAKTIALNHADVTSNQVTFVHVNLERDNGIWIYDVEFYTADYKEYDYEINANTGSIISVDYDAEEYNRPNTTSPSTETGNYIGNEKAKQIALSRAGVAANSVYNYKCSLDRDNGMMLYEIEFKSGGYDYEVDINANTGNIVKYDKEWD